MRRKKELSQTSQPHKLSAIQTLRAIAVLGVIIFHLDSSWLPGGFLGVDIFFVVSGFVITQSLLRNSQRRLLRTLSDFYSKRFLRIAPALFVFLGTTAILVALFVPKGFFALGGDAARTSIAAVFGLSNVSLYLSDQGYFEERLHFNAFAHTWSLGVEEQFYVLFPFVLWLSVWSFVKQRSVNRRVLPILVIGVLTVFSFTWSIWETEANPLGAFYLLTSRFWELGVGALLALVLAATRSRVASGRLRVVVLALGSALLTVSFFMGNKEAFPFPWALPAVLGTLALIAGYTFFPPQPGQTRLDKFVSNRLLITIGDWSYSLYLWHWGVIVLMRWTTGLEHWWHFFLALALTFLMGSMSYRFVEQPILNRKIHTLVRPAKIGVVAVMASALVASALYLGDRATGPLLSLSVASQGKIFDPPASTPDPEVEYERYAGIGEGRQVFVVGDSHARHLGTLLTEMRAVMGFEFTVVDDRDCPVARLFGSRGNCDEHVEVVDEVLQKASPGDVVVLSSLRTPRISSLVDGQYEDLGTILDNFVASQVGLDDHRIVEEAAESVRAFESAGLVVVVTTPTPVFPSPIFRCSDWFNEINPVCAGGFQISRDYMQALAEPTNRRIAMLESESNIVVWNIFDTMCPGKTCSTLRDGRHLFFDGDHLSRWGNYELMPGFVSLVDTHW